MFLIPKISEQVISNQKCVRKSLISANYVLSDSRMLKKQKTNKVLYNSSMVWK